MIKALRICLGQLEVGTLTYFEDNEDYEFSFSEDYLKDPDRPILGQFFEDRRPNSIETSGMPCWFANLLPQNILRNVVAKAFALAEHDNFGLLRVLGEDLPGAVIARAGEPRSPAHLSAPGDVSENLQGEDTLSPGLKFSLAGVQLKLSVRENGRGLVVPVHGQTGRWIAKFDGPGYPELPRVEFATMTWARESQISIPEFRLANVSDFEELPRGLQVGEGQIFLIRRFDRQGDEIADRVHIEDFAQILDRPPGNHQYHSAYEEIAAVLSYVAPDALPEFVRRLVFTLLCGNGDAHLKNWSLIYPDGRTPTLSPAYDFVSTILYMPSDSLALSLAGTKQFATVSDRSFLPLSKASRTDPSILMQWVRQAVNEIWQTWRTSCTHFDFTGKERTHLENHLNNSPLARAFM